MFSIVFNVRVCISKNNNYSITKNVYYVRIFGNLSKLGPYMSTQRDILEGQTGSHRAKRANSGRGSGGAFQNPILQNVMVQYTLTLSIFVNIMSLYCMAIIYCNTT